MKSKNLIIILWLLSLLTVAITVGIYLFKFGSFELSDNEQTWVNFANFFNGIVAPIVTVLNLIILTYLTIKLVKIEDDRNTWTLQELARPYGVVLFENTKSSINISIHNIGMGPMVITSFTILNNSGKIFNNFSKLIAFIDPLDNTKFAHVDPKCDSFEVNSDKGAIGKDQSYCLLKLYFENDTKTNRDYLDYIRNELNEYTLHFSYDDIYGRNIENMIEKLHFKPWQVNGHA